MSPRRALAIVLALVPVGAFAACSASNGDPIGRDVRDAAALDAGSGPGLPDAPSGGDGSSAPDAGPDGSVDAADAAASPPVVTINEIYVSNDGGGDNAEYVELRAAPGTKLDHLVLRLLNATGTPTQPRYEVAVAAAGDKVDATGTWVVGGALAPGRVDNIVSLANWGLDNARGAVQLVWAPPGAAPMLLDVVGWTTDEDAGAIPPPASPPLATGEGKRAVVPAIAQHSFGRKQGAADTNDNKADFCSMTRTAGNTTCVCD